jgi:hypothetical protein
LDREMARPRKPHPGGARRLAVANVRRRTAWVPRALAEERGIVAPPAECLRCDPHDRVRHACRTMSDDHTGGLSATQSAHAPAMILPPLLARLVPLVAHAAGVASVRAGTVPPVQPPRRRVTPLANDVLGVIPPAVVAFRRASRRRCCRAASASIGHRVASICTRTRPRVPQRSAYRAR